MTEILLLRHGESEWNALGRWQGHADPPLSPLGRLQATHAASRLGSVEAVMASDLCRAVETASIIAGQIGLEVADRVADLRERRAGPWEGLTRDEIEACWPGYLEDGRRPDGYEGDDVLLARTRTALTRIGAAYTGCRIVVVSHGGVIRAHERQLGVAEDTRIPNLGGRWLVVVGDEITAGAREVLVDHDELTRPPET